MSALSASLCHIYRLGFILIQRTAFYFHHCSWANSASNCRTGFPQPANLNRLNLAVVSSLEDVSRAIQKQVSSISARHVYSAAKGLYEASRRRSLSTFAFDIIPRSVPRRWMLERQFGIHNLPCIFFSKGLVSG